MKDEWQIKIQLSDFGAHVEKVGDPIRERVASIFLALHIKGLILC
jgi:hypothetical protein